MQCKHDRTMRSRPIGPANLIYLYKCLQKALDKINNRGAI